MSKSAMKPKKEGILNEKKPGSRTSSSSKKAKDIEEEAEEMKKRTDKILEKERNSFLEQMQELIKELERLKTENDKLRRQQEQKMGVTAETVDRMKKDLDHAKATNNFLLTDIEDRKHQATRLETESFELKMKLEAMTKKLNATKKMSESQKVEIEELSHEKSRAERALEENRKLRRFLMSNQIDSRTGKPLSEIQRDKRLAGQKKTVTIRSTLKSKSLEAVNKKFVTPSKSLEDIRKLEEYYGVRSARSDEKDRKSCFGYYTDILKKRQSLLQKKSKK